MTRIADAAGAVTGGVDTHADVHVTAVVDQVGRVVGTASFPACEAGYRAALAWMRSRGELARVGVEGTGSYGAGLARYLAAQGVEVAEVIRPNRQRRRRRGKSDSAGAVSAAIAALNGEQTSTPKSRDGAAESIRAVKAARRGAVKAHTQAANQLRDLIVTAPAPLRAQLSGLDPARRARAAAALPLGEPGDPCAGVNTAMASLGRRWQDLGAEIARLDAALDQLLQQAAPPKFLASQGVGTQSAAALITTCGDNPGRIHSEASFAALCGTSAVDASSGKQQRHRLNRGGDRQANCAIWRIVMTRIQHDSRTQAYLARRTAEGKTRKEIIRSLKRYVTREVYKKLIRPDHTPSTRLDTRQAA